MSSVPPLWLDQPDALDRVGTARASGQISDVQAAAARDLIESGFTVVGNVAPAILFDQVADDFAHYLREHAEYAAKCVDAHGRHLRFVNFHAASEAALELGNVSRIMSLLDFLFARSAGIYTSLLFEYGSQQPIHRDSPFFHTFPINYFFGVWFALEDIHPDSGPLIYVPGGHRFQVKHRMIFEQLERQNPQQSTKELLDRDWNATTARSSQRRRKSRLHVQWCSRRETVQFGIRSAPWRYEGQQSDADTKEHSLSLCSHRRASFISKVFFSPPTSNRPPLWLSRISRAPLCGGRPPLLPGRTRGIKFNHMDEMFGKPAAPAGKQFSWQGKAVS